MTAKLCTKSAISAYFADAQSGVAKGSVVTHLKSLRAKKRVHQPGKGLWGCGRRIALQVVKATVGEAFERCT